MDGLYASLSLLLLLSVTVVPCQGYYGQLVGSFPDDTTHEVSGTVYAVNETALLVVDFIYDGDGPDAFFWVSGTNIPDSAGVIASANGSMEILGAYDGENVVVGLPDDVMLGDVKSLSVWCRQFAANFGHVKIPKAIRNNPLVPFPIGPIVEEAHDFKASEVVVENTKTFLIQDLYYDGRGPAAYFWVGDGNKPNSQGEAIPDENGSPDVLKAYNGETIRLTLPGEMTVEDIEYLGAYCVNARMSFGHVSIPGTLENEDLPPYVGEPEQVQSQLSNCEPVHDDLQIWWEIENDDLVVELIGRIDDDGYMAFGVSGSTTSTQMGGADVIVASYDVSDGEAKAQDYKITGYTLCSSGQGVCPEDGRKDNVVVQNSESSRVDGITTVRYKRPLDTGDNGDEIIDPDVKTYFVWALGNLNRQGMVTKHDFADRTSDPFRVKLGRNANNNCGDRLGGGSDSSEVTPWEIKMLDSTDAPFYVTIGPAGGLQGYTGITGRQSWGIAFYVNGKLIPEITLIRNKTYTFTIETGDDPDSLATYHPVYITDDAVGGYLDKSQAQRRGVNVYAGLDEDGEPFQSAVGRYCEWTPEVGSASPDDYATFNKYKRTLTLDCDVGGQEGTFDWTPDEDTPDLVYYQCYAHNYLGWKIHITDGGSGISASWMLLLMLLMISIMWSPNM